MNTNSFSFQQQNKNSIYKTFFIQSTSFLVIIFEDFPVWHCFYLYLSAPNDTKFSNARVSSVYMLKRKENPLSPT